jgi:hypothetical protein
MAPFLAGSSQNRTVRFFRPTSRRLHIGADFALPHDGDAVAAYHRQIVADEQHVACCRSFNRLRICAWMETSTAAGRRRLR